MKKSAPYRCMGRSFTNSTKKQRQVLLLHWFTFNYFCFMIYCTFSSFKVTRGFKRLKPRGRKCAEITNRYLDLATGRMYAQKRFGEKEKQHVRLLSFTQSHYCFLHNQITAFYTSKLLSFTLSNYCLLQYQITVFYTIKLLPFYTTNVLTFTQSNYCLLHNQMP